MGISYVVDVYRRETQPSSLARLVRVPVVLPAPVAGPIVRTEELSPRSAPAQPPDIDASRAAYLIMGGLFKKVVLSTSWRRRSSTPCSGAPNAALVAGDPRRDLRVRRADLLRLQRLHGHRDRVALLLGFRLPQNFDRAVHRALAAGLLAPVAHDAVPVAARLPVHPARAARRAPSAKTYRNIMITMAARRACGTARRGLFLVWGVLHGVGQCVGRYRRKQRLAAGRRRGGRRAPRAPFCSGSDVPLRVPGLGVLRGSDSTAHGVDRSPS